MSEAPLLLASLSIGVLLGLAFFGGLWLTINGLDRAEHPARRMLASLLLRFCVAIAGFYLLVRFGGWQHVLAGGAGFVIARFLVMRATRPGRADSAHTD